MEYIRDRLHPRLRALGQELAARLESRTGVELRCQLRSGRWHRNPWATWVSVVAAAETERSDPNRPRLSVFMDGDEVIAGYCQSIWRKRWREVVRRKGLAEVIDEVAKKGRLKIGIAHWEEGVRRTIQYRSGKRALEAAAELGQDFFVVGRTYLWPDKEPLVCSARFLEEVDAVFAAAWPVYHLAFFGERA